MLGLYIHIPFCKSICSYCDFPKRIKKNDLQENDYIKSVIQELEDYHEYFNAIKTIYIGGGTPNNLSLINLTLILESLSSLKPCEFSIEVNPELLTLEQIKLFKHYGINRISIGVETFNPKYIKLLGRHHTKEMVFDKVRLLREYGFNNLNIDMIDGFFYQSKQELIEDVKTLLELDLEHISYYNMILEDKTIFSYQYNKGLLPKIDDDLVYEMDKYIRATLKSSGYNHYEISNYAKPGYESIHNEIYWQTESYIGIGAGASSYLNHYRYTNYSDLNKYFDFRFDTRDFIDIPEQKNEFMMLGLRMLKGVSLKKYHLLFNTSFMKDYQLDTLIEEGLLSFDGDYLKLTDKGLDLGNVVFREFVR